jgi:hypothetical protein
MNTPFLTFGKEGVTMSSSSRVRIAYIRSRDHESKSDPELERKFEFWRKIDPPNEQWKAAKAFLNQQGFDSEPIIDHYLKTCETIFARHPEAQAKSSISIEPLGDEGQQVVRFRIFIGIPYLEARIQKQFMKPFADKSKLYATVCIYHEPL